MQYWASSWLTRNFSINLLALAYINGRLLRIFIWLKAVVENFGSADTIRNAYRHHQRHRIRASPLSTTAQLTQIVWCATPSTTALLLASTPGWPSSTAALRTRKRNQISLHVLCSTRRRTRMHRSLGTSHRHRESDGRSLMNVRGAIIMGNTTWKRSGLLGWQEEV